MIALTSLLLAAVAVQATPPDDQDRIAETVDRAAAEAEADTVEDDAPGGDAWMRRIVDRYRAYERYRDCLFDRADALAHDGRLGPDIAFGAALRGCSDRRSEFEVAVEATGLQPSTDEWFADAIASALSGALQAAEAQ